MLDLDIRFGPEHVIGGARFGAWQNKALGPWVGAFRHSIRQGPHCIPPGNDLADISLDSTKAARPRHLGRLDQEPGDEVELDRKPGAAMQLKTRHEAASREEGVGFVDVPKNEYVLPWDKHVVHDDDRVILVESARQRIVERAAENGRALF